MKYSKLFGKTIKDSPKDATMQSHKLLYQGGFIRESTAGRYYYLPLGWRVHDKIKRIIKEEMDKAGAQEMITPVLHPLELWKETNRTNTVGFELMVIKDARGAEFALGGTAEEMFVDVVRKFQLSYKDLPFNIYQFSTKFRDEKRARGGLLRVREFVMKDAYSFDRNEEEFKKTYDLMTEAYKKIYERVGLETLMVPADNGYIGGEYCHEFQVIHPSGEGKFFVSEDGNYVAHEDIATFHIESVNLDEKEEDFKIVEQPEWVKTMEDFEKHYDKDSRFFLKNVVYRNNEGDIIIGTLRGDLQVNKTKLEHIVDMVGQLEEATEEDLAAIGTKTGYVHSWGHKFINPRKAKSSDRKCRVIYVADKSLKSVKNFIGGQKEDKTDSINVNYGRDFTHELEGDIALAEEGFLAPDGKSKIYEQRGIEVGNIFQLGYHYTSLMKNGVFMDEDGKEKKFYMGCYGIGLGRTLATIVEKHNDETGIIWPESVAPFRVHLISIAKSEDDESFKKADKLYNKLNSMGIETLWDDRIETRPGEKFTDADLIGIPFRVVISERTGDNFEIKKRSENEAKIINETELLKLIK